MIGLLISMSCAHGGDQSTAIRSGESMTLIRSEILFVRVALTRFDIYPYAGFDQMNSILISFYNHLSRIMSRCATNVTSWMCA